SSRGTSPTSSSPSSTPEASAATSSSPSRRRASSVARRCYDPPVVVKVAKRSATYADLEALPEHLVGEIIDGDLFVSPRPAVPHAAASSAIGVDIGGPFQ